MHSPRFLGSRLFFWLIMPWVILGIVAFVFIAKGHFDEGKNMAGLLAGYFAFLCMIGMYAMTSKRHGLFCGRIIAGSIALAYAAYFIDTYFIEGRSLMPTGRKSDSTPFNAILGFIAIGLPCAQFAITGMPFWGLWRKNDTSQSSETPTIPANDTTRSPS